MTSDKARQVYPQLMAAYEKAKADGRDRDAEAIRQELGLDD